jgi:biopolymer transport protein ExbD
MLTGLVLCLGPAAWLETRNPVPLDIPVSLSPGQIKTQEFQINLNSIYLIGIAVEPEPSLSNLYCQMSGCYDSPAILRARWTLSDGVGAQTSGVSDELGQLYLEGALGRSIGGFKSLGGRYRLDVEVLSDASVLNKGNPRLIVVVDADRYYRIRHWAGASSMLGGIFGIIAIALLWRSRPGRVSGRPMFIKLFPDSRTGYGSAFQVRRPPLGVLLSRIPHFGLYLAFVSMLVVFSMVFLLGLSAVHSHGIRVLTSSRTLRSPRLEQWTPPLVLRIDRKERWFLNGNPVTPEQFPGVLKEALSRRSDWSVCLDADPKLDYGMVSKAIDAIQGLYSKIILMTPELEHDRCNGDDERF